MDVTAMWRRWHAFSAKQTPDIVQSLNGPASENDLQALSGLGFPLPESLVASLRIHDGQSTDSLAEFFAGGGRLLSAAEIPQHRDMLREALSDLDDFDDLDSPPQGIGPVRCVVFSENRLPIADCNGDVTWFLDFDPLPGGQVGQVIRVDLESTEWVVCADSYGEFFGAYVDALEGGQFDVLDGELDAEECWPPLEQLPAADGDELDETRVLQVGKSGRWDVALKLLRKLPEPSAALEWRVVANAACDEGDNAAALKALAELRRLGEENDDDRELLLELLEEGEDHTALQTEVNHQIARMPSAALYARRARLHGRMATEPPRKGSYSQDMEWLASPAGQQHTAVCLERAIEDFRRARAMEDCEEWRLDEGECLLDMARWEEAEAHFSEAVEQMEAALDGEEPGEWSQEGMHLARARDGLRRAQTRDEGGDDAMMGDMEGLMALLGEMGRGEQVEELRDMLDTFARLKEDGEAEQAERDADPDRLERDARSIAEQIMRRHPDQPERHGPFPLELLDEEAARYYDGSRDQLVALGFDVLGDIEPLNHSETSGKRVMIRLLRSPDRKTIAAVWRLVGAFSVVEAVELESWLEDDSLLLTNNTGAANPFEAPPQVKQQSLPQGCAIDLLVDAHAQRLDDDAHAGRQIGGLDDVLAMQEHQRLIKREHARQNGWVSDAELRGLLGASYRDLAPRVQAILRDRN
ncbi:MAG TPA: SMI1/KNR4 family protein [Xanthomonadaceae bacterium]|nr:SMI1/KNR4 family protein [Xanthomonadaceae bacterium]